MRRMITTLAVCLTIAVTAAGDDSSGRILVLDDCDPTDAAWDPIGGCTLDGGEVSTAEFDAFLIGGARVPAQGGSYGHPSWRYDAEYRSVKSGRRIMVTNDGGRPHTFTPVAAFGGGFVPILNNPIGAPAVPECANPATVANDLLPGASVVVRAENPGVHLFQCCRHPWMRTAIRVTAKD